MNGKSNGVSSSPDETDSSEKPRSSCVNSLDGLRHVLYATILRHQHPITGLLPSSEDSQHAWVRDNTYCALALWGMSMALKKHSDLEEECARTFEMEQRVVKCMRGMLLAMMRQRDKVEQFKDSQCPTDALHAKYNVETGERCVGDDEWGHLQIDATSLYLLALAQMTAAGLQIIFTLDEVALVQNLVFYVESAYFTADYGVWERGDKTNHGLPELNASSIGMAKAAMQAMNHLDLFGSHGGPASVIHVMPDEVHKCEAVLQSMLPRESLSKELDSALLAVIGFPAFAVSDSRLIDATRSAILDKMVGKYGCKRFLRDGYMTCREDRNRLYYEPWELRLFDQIECQWPLFFALLAIERVFAGDTEGMQLYVSSLERVLVTTADGHPAVPEMYAVPEACVEAELKEPNSQPRRPVGRVPFYWAQSLYVLVKLLQLQLLQPAELDPLNRRLCAEKKPDVVVQVAVLAENDLVRRTLAQQHDIHLQTVEEVRSSVEIRPARLLGQLFTRLGMSRKLGLTGRASLDVGTLSTSILYTLQGQVYAFTPQFTDSDRFFFASDTPFFIDTLLNEINFLQSSWHGMLGRPLVTLVFCENQLERTAVVDGAAVSDATNLHAPALYVQTLRKINTGYVHGTRVVMGFLKDFINTSCLSSLEFLNDHEQGRSDFVRPEITNLLEQANAISGQADVKLRSRFTRQTTLTSSSGQQLDSALRLSRRRSVRRLSSSGGEDDDDPSAGDHPTSPLVTVSTPCDDNEMFVEGSGDTGNSVYDRMSDSQLIDELIGCESLEERADVLQYLVGRHSLSYRIPASSLLVSQTSTAIDGFVSVRELYEQLYEQACSRQRWALARHSAGMLGRRLADLAKSLADLLVRQKQVTVGASPDEQAVLTPLPAAELTELIHQAHGDDETRAMLTQELIVYMSMLIRTEPQLFSEMLRLRTGLIIQILTGELQRLLKCPLEEATEALVNLSPFNMKTLLYHILSGKDFGISTAKSGHFSVSARRSAKVSHRSEFRALSVVNINSKRARSVAASAGDVANCLNLPAGDDGTEQSCDEEMEEHEEERLGQWLRRRRLDGALNRVPLGFYPRVYRYLSANRSVGVYVANRLLSHSLTEEMTAGEPKFALEVESALTQIGEPEYRQLTVEALMVLTLLSEHSAPLPDEHVHVERLVYRANQLFLEDQREGGGDATLCCACQPQRLSDTGGLVCGGAAFICRHFYDSAPSGRYGTMMYMVRAMASSFACLPDEGVLDCSIC